MNPPRVSVLMPVYNGAPYLREAVDSILRQTYTDYEFIIVDDGSTDETPAILAGYAQGDPRVILAWNHGNLGLVQSLNRGLGLARGEYVARMDADDISLPNRFERQVTYLDQHPEVGVLGTNAIYVNGQGQPLRNGRLQDRRQLTCEVIRWMLLWRCPVLHSGVLLRRHVLSRWHMLYDPAYRHAEDRELWTRLSKRTCIASLYDVLLHVRITRASVSRQHKDEQRAMDHAITRRELTALLGEPTSDALETLISIFSKHPVDAKADYAGAAELLFRAYHRFAERPLERKDRMQIEADVASRLTRIAYEASGSSPATALSLLGRLRQLPLDRSLRLVTCKRALRVLLRTVGVDRDQAVIQG